MRHPGFGWLARRLILGRRDRLSSVVVLGGAVALLTMLLLATIAVPQIVAKQSQRNNARTPDLSYSRSVTHDAKLLAPEASLVAVGNRWGSHVIDRQVYAIRDGGGDLRIPGTDRAPRPTEYFASPELANLIKTDPTVHALFAGRHMIGTIGQAGLLQPHELRAIEGMPPNSPLLNAVTGFGQQESTRSNLAPANLTWSVVAAAATCVWAPGIILLVVSSRFTSRSRAIRARALRLQGLPVRAVRIIMAAEVGVVGLPAAAVGAAGYILLVHRVTAIPGTSFGYYASDATPAWGTILLALLLVVAASSVSAAYSLPLEESEPAIIRRLAPRRAVVVGLALLSIGLGYLVVTPLLVRYTKYASVGIWPAICCVLIGVSTAGPRLVMIWSKKAASRSKSAGSVVGLRLNSWSVTTAMRLGTLGAVLVIVMLGMVAFVNVLTGGSTKSWSDAMRSNPTVAASVSDLTGQLTRSDLTPVARNHSVAAQIAVRVKSTKGTRQQAAILASCQDLSGLVGSQVHGCSRSGAWIQTGASAPPTKSGSVALGDDRRVMLPKPTNVIRMPGGPRAFNGALVLPPDAAPSAGATFYLLVDGKNAEQAFATISGRSMTSQFELGRFDSVWPGFRQYQAEYEWLIVGIVAGVLCGAVTLLCGVLGERDERMRRFDGMVAVGASKKDLVSAHYWATTWPTLVIGFFGTSVGWLVTHEMQVFDDRAYVPPQLFLGALAAVVVVSFGIATVSIRDPLRRTRIASS